MSDSNLINSLNETLQLSIPLQSNQEELILLLSAHINKLINADFEQLVNLLYRVDINEKKLKECLANSPGADTAPLIARMIIIRQEEKIKSRQQFRQRDQSIDEEDRW